MLSYLRELELIAERYHPKSFKIWDENFTASNFRLKEFCRLYRLEQTWICDSRVDTLSEQKIEMMKEAGCEQINLGVESGSQKILDYLGKGLKTESIEKVFDLLHKYNIKSKAYVITGFPKETEQDMLESIEFIKLIKPDSVTLSLFTPYASTDLFLECQQDGLIDDDYDESDYSHQSGNFLKKIHPEIDINGIIKSVDDYNKALVNA
jgi:radical SAM superfamily enzyme YgiQ (UPF0313 family)